MNQRDIFVEIKKEDRSFGEKMKSPRNLNGNKKQKHRTDFKRFNKQDFEQMENEDFLQY